MRRRGLIPSPDVSWIWGFICDEGPKTDEFIRMYCDADWETCITRLPHDQPWGTVEDEVDERVNYLAEQMKDGFEFIQKKIGVNVSEENIHQALKMWLNYTGKLAELYRLMASDPQPLGGEEGAMFIASMARPFNTGMGPMERALDITIQEVKGRVERGEGMLPKGAPKLMAYAIPQSLPWITKIFEENGVGLTYIEVLMPGKKMLEPLRFQDPFKASAELWLRRSQSVNIGYKAQIICEKIRTYGVDGMLFGLMDFDRWLGTDNRLLAKVVEEETRLPVFYIEGDNWDDRDYSQEALRTRIESICEIMKMRKA
jgi:benzoyl-CoA reductase/2-hydroxyglutaryl-CoA dehydratase subunit BcrC/BadD/HgdB